MTRDVKKHSCQAVCIEGEARKVWLVLDAVHKKRYKAAWRYLAYTKDFHFPPADSQKDQI